MTIQDLQAGLDLCADPLAFMLERLSVRCSVREEWVLKQHAARRTVSPEAIFHFVLRGTCLIETEHESVALDSATLILLPRGGEHTLSWRREGNPAVDSYRQWRSKENDVASDASGCTILSGDVRFTEPGWPPIRELFPSEFLIVQRRCDDPLIAQMLPLIAMEAEQGPDGSRAIVNSMLTLVYLQVVRTHLCVNAAGLPVWYRGMQDPDIGQIITAMFQAPERPWTVEALADTGQMARSTFARRFRELVGKSPMDALLQVRMWMACELIEQSGLGMKTIAQRVGYRSVSAFSAAFRRCLGTSPQLYRKGSMESVNSEDTSA